MDPAPSRWRLARRGALVLLSVCLLGLLYWWFTWPDVQSLADHPPATTAFIERVRERGDRVAWIWVPDDRIGSAVKRAAVSGEDLEFFFHHGFSQREMWAAFKEGFSGGRARGASTITQQLAKNLWLSPSRNPLRKVKEALLTRQLERNLSKRRILELYLNVAEFGPGLYGVEAAARRYFGKSAADLSDHEGAELAASLPRPSDWHPGVASPYYAAYVAEIERRMTRAAFLTKYVGGPVGAKAMDSLIVADSLLQRLLDSISRATARDTDTTVRH